MGLKVRRSGPMWRTRGVGLTRLTTIPCGKFVGGFWEGLKIRRDRVMWRACGVGLNNSNTISCGQCLLWDWKYGKPKNVEFLLDGTKTTPPASNVGSGRTKSTKKSRNVEDLWRRTKTIPAITNVGSVWRIKTTPTHHNVRSVGGLKPHPLTYLDAGSVED